MPNSQAAPANPDLTTTLSGAIAGRFLIKEKLGKGGMGEVYRAEDLKLKRTVALKRLAPHLCQDRFHRKRFAEEAERVSSFSDAHIAALYDVIEERSEMFLVMEYVQGETLRERMKEPLPLEQTLDILAQCAEALTVPPASAMVHCDIKPENIMLTPAGQVKILDFGVAKLLPRADQSATLDRSSSMSGTPAYMSPEMLAQQQPDGRSDVFSLGVVAYELLTGRHPFLANSFVATIDRIRRDEPMRVRALNAAVPAELEAIVNKAIAKDPARRYAGAEEMAEDLRSVSSGVMPQFAELAPHRKRRQLPLWIGGCVLVLLLVAAILYTDRTRRDAPLAERGWALISDFEVRGDAKVPATGIREALSIALEQSRYVNIVPRERVFQALQRMERPSVAVIDENLGREICMRENCQLLLTGAIEQIGPSLQVVVRAVDPATGTVLFAEKERIRKGTDVYDATDALARRVRNDLGESLAGIQSNSRELAKVTTKSLDALQLYSKAYDAFLQGSVNESARLLASALQLDPGFAMAHWLLSRVHLVKGNRDRQMSELDLAFQQRESVTERERSTIEAEYFDARGAYEKSEQSLLALVSLYPDDAEAHANLAEAYAATDDYPAAIQQVRDVLKLNPNSVNSYGLLMRYLARTNAFSAALDVYDEAGRRGLHSHALDWHRGIALLGDNRLEDAVAQFSRLQEAGGAYQNRARIYLARTLILQGKLEDAGKLLLSEIGIDRTENNRSPELLSRYLLATAYLLQGRTQAAKQQLSTMLSSGNPLDLQAEDLRRVATYYARLGEGMQARRALQYLQQLTTSAPSAFNRSCYDNAAAELALASGRRQEAAGLFAAAQALYTRVMSHEGLARVYEAQRDWEKAASEWKQVVAAKGEILDDASPSDWTTAKLRLGNSYAKLHQDGKARAMYQDVAALWREADSFPEHDWLNQQLEQAAVH